MERLNKSGRILMEYRAEYKKHYSESVDENLKEAINKLYADKRIDEKIFRNIFNESLSDDSFEIMLSKRKEFVKNTSELNYEFDQVRKKLNEYMIEIGFTNSMNTKNSIDINKIIIIHQFDLNRPYIMASFGVNQTEIIPLMKRRGFVEKFAVLRLNQVLKEIYAEMRMPEDIDHGYSLVYYNKKTQSFSIDYKFYVNVELVSNESKMKELVNKIRELDKIIDRKFHTKLGNNYFNESKNNANSLKIEPKEKPTSKQPVVEPVKNIIEKTNKTPGNEPPKDPSKETSKEPPKQPGKEPPIKQSKPETKDENKQSNNDNKDPQAKPVYQVEERQIPKKKDKHKNQTAKPIDRKQNIENQETSNNKEESDSKKTPDSFDEIVIEFDVSDKDLL